MRISFLAIAADPQTPAAGAHYTVDATTIGELLDGPAAKAVLQKDLPAVVNGDQIDLARGMTLKEVQQYAPDQVTDEVLAKVDADLAKLPAK